MEKIDETIELMEKQLKELRKFKEQSKEDIDRNTMIEERLEQIEKTLVMIKNAIVGK